jgi:hypothetical protein
LVTFSTRLRHCRREEARLTMFAPMPAV